MGKKSVRDAHNEPILTHIPRVYQAKGEKNQKTGEKTWWKFVTLFSQVFAEDAKGLLRARKSQAIGLTVNTLAVA